MKEEKKNQLVFKNQTVLKLKESDFKSDCFSCKIRAVAYSVVLIPESCKEIYLDENQSFKRDLLLNSNFNAIVAYY